MTNVHPPATLEGWYSLCVCARFDGRAWRSASEATRQAARSGAHEALARLSAPASGGWTETVTLVGSTSDVLLLHLRPTFEDIAEVRRLLRGEPLWDFLIPTFSFLSVTEAALYGVSTRLLEETLARGGEVGDATYREALDLRLREERLVAHVQHRLYPVPPADMPYVCFYPMSKRRHAPHNWYALPLVERERLMQGHGLTGRRYRGRIAQIVTGATGFEEWEWGVTLFARDALDIKHVVTDMRYDPASADYAEFGEFFVGRRNSASEWLDALHP
ncbi:MAG: chlorite dismutase family protein [Gemmatimonadaceae bacterium]